MQQPQPKLSEVLKFTFDPLKICFGVLHKSLRKVTIKYIEIHIKKRKK